MNTDNILDQPVNDDTYLEAEEYHLASAGQRFANHIIDTIIIYALTFGVLVIMALYGTIISDEDTFLVYIILFSVFLSYYLFFEGVLGITVGKLITRTKLLDEDGYKASFANVLGRTFCRLIPFDAFSYLGSDAVGWHDSLSRTRVVKKN